MQTILTEEDIKLFKRRYQVQRNEAISIRGIEWNLTFDQWLAWWGDDIWNRGCRAGQLVMARYGDQGAYEIGNIRKASPGENNREAHCGKPAWNRGKPGNMLGKKLTPAQREKISLKAKARWAKKRLGI